MFKNKEIKNLFLIFLITRICYLIYQIITIPLVGNNFLDVYNFMDSINYLHIAKYGYTETKFYTFFPLIPILIKLLSIYGLVIINNIVAFISSIMIYKNFNKNAAILFLLSPIQIYCYIPYTESIFICLTLLSYYFFKNKKNILLGLTLGIGVCCRSVGSMMFFAIFIIFVYDIYIKNRTIKELFTTYIYATLISLLYPIYLQLTYGKWNIFITAQYECWDATNSNIFKTIYLDIQSFFQQDLYGKYLILLTYIALSLMILALLKYKNFNKVLLIYSVFSIIAIFSKVVTIYNGAMTPPSMSFFRYIYGCYPIYIGLSFYKNQKLIRSIFIILHILIGLNFFINGWPF